jgi:hypothetical protein
MVARSVKIPVYQSIRDEQAKAKNLAVVPRIICAYNHVSSLPTHVGYPGHW